MIRCVTLDAVGTLIEAVPPVADVYFDAARRHGSRYDRPDIARRFARAWQADVAGDRNTSEAREISRWRAIVAEVLDDVGDAETCFEELYEHFAQPAAWQCFDDVAEVVDELLTRGFSLAIASNFDARLHAICDRLEPLARIPLRLISSEIGVRKPARDFFRAVIEKTGCRPHELLMVGDDPECDIRGARRCGIEAVKLCRDGPAAVDGEIGSLRGLLERLP